MAGCQRRSPSFRARQAHFASRPLIVVAALLLGLAAAAFWYGYRRPDYYEVDTLQLRAVAYLENNQLNKARDAFMELLRRLPGERSVVQNLAVCEVLALDKSDSADADAAAESSYAAAERAVNAFLAQQPDSPIAHFLHARLLKKVRDTNPSSTLDAEIVAAYQRAEGFDPQNPVFPYERFSTVITGPFDPLSDVEVEAIQQVYRLAPDNLFVQLHYALILARQGSSDLGRVVEQIAVTLRPHFEGDMPSENVRRSLADVRSQLDGGDAEELLNAVLRLFNNTKATELSRADLRRIEPNVLEFVVHDLTHPRSPVDVRAAAETALEFRTMETKGVPDDLEGIVAVQAIDFDMDRRLDVLLLRSGSLQIYTRGEGSGSEGSGGERWTLLTSAVVDDGVRGMIVSDLDRDDATLGSDTPPIHVADPDVVVFGRDGVQILRNVKQADGTRVLELVIQPTQNPELREVAQATFADLDHDGDLDIAFAGDAGLTLWSNRGDMTFSDISSWSELPTEAQEIRSLIAVDWDRDVDVDLLIAGASGARGYLENLRHGHFRWRPASDKFAGWNDAEEMALIESDGNASWDLLVSSSAGTKLLQTKTAGSTVTSLRTLEVTNSALNLFSIVDLDNDGSLDFLALDGAKLVAWRGGQTKTGFAAFSKLPAGDVRAFDFGDVDSDGDEDLLVADATTVFWMENRGGNANQWIDFRIKGLREAEVGRVNHYAIGSVIELKSPQGYQAQVVSRPWTHFGVGKGEPPSIARVIFPNGVPQSVLAPSTNTFVEEDQKNLGSCPFLYTWNGQEFVFCTDLLWNSPLGLPMGNGQLMPARPWEYIKVDGRNLQPRNGRYELRITEELWEASYFDLVELMAVDHPIGTEVYSNEKVGPAAIADFKIHVASDRRLPQAARDSSGRDMLPAIRTRDQQYCQPFRALRRKGLAEEHYLELELGDLGSPGEIKLYLTGWIAPTDSNLNMQLGQHPQLDPPQPPSVWVPDEKGDWVEAISFMGFPSGKTKTIVVDMSNRFIASDYRLRIKTSAALRWDEIFFTVDDQSVEVRTQIAPLTKATLRYLGFCKPNPAVEGGPESFNYQQIESGPMWPPMSGKFTRYGRVESLLAAVDDQLAIFGAGDEIALEFAALPDPVTGWTRDYILRSVGWEKDCLLNTVQSQTVEPIPFQEMAEYPEAGRVRMPDEGYSTYLRKYQTRTQSPADYWRMLHRGPID